MTIPRNLQKRLKRMDAHIIQPEEYDDAPELTDEQIAAADLYEGEKLIRRGGRPLTISVRRATELAPIGVTTIYKLMKQGKLKSSVVLGRRMIDYGSFLELIQPPRKPPTEPVNGGEGLRTVAKGKRPKIQGNPERSARLRRYAKGG